MSLKIDKYWFIFLTSEIVFNGTQKFVSKSKILKNGMMIFFIELKKKRWQYYVSEAPLKCLIQRNKFERT